jgi:hypothetical protein
VFEFCAFPHFFSLFIGKVFRHSIDSSGNVVLKTLRSTDEELQSTSEGAESTDDECQETIVDEKVVPSPVLGHHTIMAYLMLTCDVVELDIFLDSRCAWVKKYYTLSHSERDMFWNNFTPNSHERLNWC